MSSAAIPGLGAWGRAAACGLTGARLRRPCSSTRPLRIYLAKLELGETLTHKIPPRAEVLGSKCCEAKISLHEIPLHEEETEPHTLSAGDGAATSQVPQDRLSSLPIPQRK